MGGDGLSSRGRGLYIAGVHGLVGFVKTPKRWTRFQTGASELFAGREHCEKLDRLIVAVVAHLIILVSDRVFAFTRLMAVAPALALASILGHLVPPIRQYWFALAAERPPHARA